MVGTNAVTVCTRCPSNSHTTTSVNADRTSCVCDENYRGPSGGPCQCKIDRSLFGWCNFIVTITTPVEVLIVSVAVDIQMPFPLYHVSVVHLRISLIQKMKNFELFDSSTIAITSNVSDSSTFCVCAWDILPDTENCGLRMRRECRERFPRHQLQRKPLVSDPGMHHDTCVTRVPRCISGSLTRGGGENVPGIPGACATRNVTYLARGPWDILINTKYSTVVWNSQMIALYV